MLRPRESADDVEAGRPCPCLSRRIYQAGGDGALASNPFCIIQSDSVAAAMLSNISLKSLTAWAGPAE